MSRSRSLPLRRGCTPRGSVVPSWHRWTPSRRCGCLRRSMKKTEHVPSTGRPSNAGPSTPSCPPELPPSTPRHTLSYPPSSLHIAQLATRPKHFHVPPHLNPPTLHREPDLGSHSPPPWPSPAATCPSLGILPSPPLPLPTGLWGGLGGHLSVLQTLLLLLLQAMLCYTLLSPEVLILLSFLTKSCTVSHIIEWQRRGLFFATVKEVHSKPKRLRFFFVSCRCGF